MDALVHQYDTEPVSQPEIEQASSFEAYCWPESPKTDKEWNYLLTETRKKVEWLREKVLTEEEKEVLRKIYCNLPEKQEYKDWEQLNSHDTLRQAIEKQTLKLIKPEGLNLYVISLNWNVDYFYNEDWSIYWNFKSFSEKYSQMIINDLAEFYWAETTISDSWEISININWVAVPPLSDKYILMMYSSLESTIKFLEALEEYVEE